MNFREQYGPTALITGAGNGLGAEFARQLAARGLDLLLVDIDGEALEQVAAEPVFRAVQVPTLVADLADSDAVDQIIATAGQAEIGLLVNNAGISPAGAFSDQPVDLHLKTVAINVTAPLRLTHALGEQMLQRQRGGMIFLSSMSALQGTPNFAHYAATKAWNMILAEGLWQEWGEQGVDVLGVLPGQTRTPGFTGTGANLARAQGPVMEVGPTVTETLDTLGRQPSLIPGRRNRLLAALLRHAMPRAVAIRMVAKGMRRLYGADH